MRHRYLFVLFGLLCAVGVEAEVTGSWWGKLRLGAAGSLRIVIEVMADSVGGGGYKATLKSPDQNEQAVAAVVDYCSGDSLAVSIGSLGAAYRGRVEEGRLCGTFSQAGKSFPLDMIPGDGSYGRPQTPQPPFGYATEEVRFVNHVSNDTLAGTLCIPKGADSRTPVVLMVTGSGLQNRDEELAGHKPFAVIADHLARNGIASLRYDDRGFGESTGNGTTATTHDFATDADAGLAYLRGLGRFGSVGVVGHSEGGTIAIMIGACPERKAAADFVISLAGGMIPGHDILISQNRKLLSLSGYSEEVVNLYCKALQQLWGEPGEAPIDTSSLPAELRTNLLVIPMHTAKSPWTKAFLKLDPRVYIASLRCPVMAVNGSLDCQVMANENLSALENGLPASTPRHIVTYPGLNHLLQPALTGMPDEYSSIETTISPAVLDDITTWIKSLSN